MSKYRHFSKIFGLGASLCTILAFLVTLIKPPPPSKPETAEAHFQKALHLKDQRNRPQAEQEARQAILLQPTHKEAHKLLAACYMNDGSTKNGGQDSSLSAAANEYTRAVEIDPDDMEAKLGLAVALESLGQHDSARDAYSVVAKHHASNAEQRKIASLRLH